MSLIGGEISPQRQRLAASLRRIRLRSGISTTELGRRIGLTQSKVSRMERGRAPLIVSEVSRWAAAVGATDEESADLVVQAEAVATELSTWRSAEQSGLARLQSDIGELEASSTTIRTFQPVLIPGLLQVDEYARRVLEAGHPDGERGVAEAVAARMKRQEILYLRTKRVELLTTEQALRWRLGPPIGAQLDRVLSLSSLSNVTVAVIPAGNECSSCFWYGFNLYERDEPVVIAETMHAALMVTDPGQVDEYRRAFERLMNCAVTGDDLVTLVRRVMEEAR